MRRLVLIPLLLLAACATTNPHAETAKRYCGVDWHQIQRGWTEQRMLTCWFEDDPEVRPVRTVTTGGTTIKYYNMRDRDGFIRVVDGVVDGWTYR